MLLAPSGPFLEPLGAFLGRPGGFWGLLGPSGASWDLMGAPGASWGFLKLSGALLRPSGASWGFLSGAGAMKLEADWVRGCVARSRIYFGQLLEPSNAFCRLDRFGVDLNLILFRS